MTANKEKPRLFPQQHQARTKHPSSQWSFPFQHVQYKPPINDNTRKIPGARVKHKQLMTFIHPHVDIHMYTHAPTTWGTVIAEERAWEVSPGTQFTMWEGAVRVSEYKLGELRLQQGHGDPVRWWQPVTVYSTQDTYGTTVDQPGPSRR